MERSDKPTDGRLAGPAARGHTTDSTADGFEGPSRGGNGGGREGEISERGPPPKAGLATEGRQRRGVTGRQAGQERSDRRAWAARPRRPSELADAEWAALARLRASLCYELLRAEKPVGPGAERTSAAATEGSVPRRERSETAPPFTIFSFPPFFFIPSPICRFSCD